MTTASLTNREFCAKEPTSIGKKTEAEETNGVHETRYKQPPLLKGLRKAYLGLFRRLRTAAILTYTAFSVGCINASGTPILHLEPDISLGTYRAIELTAIKNETGDSSNMDVARKISRLVRTAFIERGIGLAESVRPVAETIVVNASLISYSPGNAAARWAAPGAGTTECIVKGSMADKVTGKHLGDFVSHRAVSYGGFFSVGADQKIIELVAEDLARSIANAMEQGEQGRAQ